MSALGFFIDVPLLTLVFILVIVFRKKIAEWFMKLKMPKFLIFLISSLPFIIFEENINNMSGTGFTLIPWTLPFLVLFILVLGLFVKWLKPRSMKYPLIGFMVFGVLWEVVIGGLRGQLEVLGVGFYTFMVFWVGLSYAFLVVVPLTILIDKKK